MATAAIAARTMTAIPAAAPSRSRRCGEEAGSFIVLITLARTLPLAALDVHRSAPDTALVVVTTPTTRQVRSVEGLGSEEHDIVLDLDSRYADLDVGLADLSV